MKADSLAVVYLVIKDTIDSYSIELLFSINLFKGFTYDFPFELDKVPLHKFLSMYQINTFDKSPIQFYCLNSYKSLATKSKTLIPASNSTTWYSINLSFNTFPFNDKLMKNDSNFSSLSLLNSILDDFIWLNNFPNKDIIVG